MIVTVDGLPFLQMQYRRMLTDIAGEAARMVRAGARRGVSEALRRGVPELSTFQVREVLLGIADVPRVTWTPAPALAPQDSVRAGWLASDRGTIGSISPGMKDEMWNRHGHEWSITPATFEDPRNANARLAGTLTLAVNDADAGVFQVLRDKGATVVNPYPMSHNSKTVMAEAWQLKGIGTPETVTRLATSDDVARAYELLGPDVVVKGPHAAHGLEVLEAHTVDEAIWNAQVLLDRNGLAPLMQRQIDARKNDFRIHYAQDWLTAETKPVGAVHRVALGQDFRTNLSLGGGSDSAVRPVYDVTGGDPVLTADLIDEGRRAGQAMGLHNFSADVARDANTGRPVVYEVDIAPMPLEAHFPMPREQQTLAHAVDLMLFSNNQRLEEGLRIGMSQA